MPRSVTFGIVPRLSRMTVVSGLSTMSTWYSVSDGGGGGGVGEGGSGGSTGCWNSAMETSAASLPSFMSCSGATNQSTPVSPVFTVIGHSFPNACNDRVPVIIFAPAVWRVVIAMLGNDRVIALPLGALAVTETVRVFESSSEPNAVRLPARERARTNAASGSPPAPTTVPMRFCSLMFMVSTSIVDSLLTTNGLVISASGTVLASALSTQCQLTGPMSSVTSVLRRRA